MHRLNRVVSLSPIYFIALACLCFVSAMLVELTNWPSKLPTTTFF